MICVFKSSPAALQHTKKLALERYISPSVPFLRSKGTVTMRI